MLWKLLQKLTQPVGKKHATKNHQRKHLALQTFYNVSDAPPFEKQYALLLKNYPHFTNAVIEKVYLRRNATLLGLSKHQQTIAGCIFVYDELLEGPGLLRKLTEEASKTKANIMRFTLCQDAEVLSITWQEEYPVYLIYNKLLTVKEKLFFAPKEGSSLTSLQGA